MLVKRNFLKFQNLFFPNRSCLTWINLVKKFYDSIKYGKKFIKTGTMNEEFFVSKNFKEIANHLFKQNKYELAKNLYTISLILIPKNRILERSLNFSNRAQCLIFLDYKHFSPVECISALKLQTRHDKSWYRKIFASKRFKDYISCLKIITTVHSLSVRFSRNHVCIQNEFYGRNIMRLGNVSFKRKRRGINFYFEKKDFLKEALIKIKFKKKKIFNILVLIKEIYVVTRWSSFYFHDLSIFYIIFFFSHRYEENFIFNVILEFRNKSNFFESRFLLLPLFSKSLINKLNLFKINTL